MKRCALPLLLLCLCGCQEEAPPSSSKADAQIQASQDIQSPSIDAIIDGSIDLDLNLIENDLNVVSLDVISETLDFTVDMSVNLDLIHAIDTLSVNDIGHIQDAIEDTLNPGNECAVDDDCLALMRCLHGVCRLPCVGTCLLETTGTICHEGLCVECASDADCLGRERCDQTRMLCAPRDDIDPSVTQIGIFYFLWHCSAVAEGPYDLSEIQAGRQPWGPYGQFHFWDEPQAGYYCLSQNDGLLRQHAEQLRDAGIDFVFLDVTNHAYVGGGSDRAQEMILRPFERLLAVWSEVPGAPQIVPWVPVPGDHEDPNQFMVDALLSQFAARPGMQLEFDGKPLLLVTVNTVHVPNRQRLEQLSARYTIREMWVFREDGPSWSFMQGCQEDPRRPEPCAQRVARRAGRVEQISIAVAYQETFMSVESATPKHGGLTFRRQFERLFDHPETPIATITGWNEWVAQRQRCGHEACPCDRYPDGCFIDTWDGERNRDIEPAQDGRGDFYYRLMRSCIEIFRRGERCEGANLDLLCCRDEAP